MDVFLTNMFIQVLICAVTHQNHLPTFCSLLSKKNTTNYSKIQITADINKPSFLSAEFVSISNICPRYYTFCFNPYPANVENMVSS